MPRLTHRLPSYRRHRASGQAVVTLGGVDHYLGKHGSKTSRTLYDRLVAEWLAAGRVAQSASKEQLTIVELPVRYLKFAKGYYLKNGRCTRVTPQIKQSLQPCFLTPDAEGHAEDDEGVEQLAAEGDFGGLVGGSRFLSRSPKGNACTFISTPRFGKR